ncbi:DUF4261 domain-containing protein [Pyxidicoccus sp. MSG2]|uniref:DUF4261 domain-containing protein n=1 Tax=Pyxidicoccus sp. MSG2 TaxID=2996790 RepID=UPI00226F7B66|nr:DUF4261 domain-containing protein [Pyxidicoccus sp. MSG2]MCY1021133.1 DUF4261 domain-containing protein [Pyxidicoccus sp. MSG2]
MRVSFVLLSMAVPLDGEAISRSHLELSSEATRLVPEETLEDGITSLRLQDGSGDVILAPVPVPIPTGEVEASAALSLASFASMPGLAPHAAHVIVTFRDEARRAPAAEALVLAQVTAAVAHATGAVGVYWGMGHVAHPAEFFIDAVRDLDLPLPALIGLSIVRDGKGLSVLSVGMEQFELPNMLVLADKAQGGEVIKFLFDMQGYVLKRGKALPDGDTVGRTAEERLRVRYVPSPTDASAQVVQVDMRKPGLWARARQFLHN